MLNLAHGSESELPGVWEHECLDLGCWQWKIELPPAETDLYNVGPKAQTADSFSDQPFKNVKMCTIMTNIFFRLSKNSIST